MTAPPDPEKRRKPAFADDPDKDDGSLDMLADADHMGVPMVFDDDGNLVSGADPLGRRT